MTAGIDQAESLRKIVSRTRGRGFALGGLRSVAVVSGKGGVGKSNIAANLALAIGEMGKSVVLLDADLGLANLDILFGITPRYNLVHVISGDKELDEVIISVKNNVCIIPGGSGVQEMAGMDVYRQSKLIDKLSILENRAEMLIIDTGAGINRNMLSFALAADSILLITTSEPTAIRDAYGILKSLFISAGGPVEVDLLVNMAASDEEAAAVADRLQMASSQFLGFPVKYIGYILADTHVVEAVKRRQPYMPLFPNCAASRCIRGVARRLINAQCNEKEPGMVPTGRGAKSFFLRLSRHLGIFR